MKKNLILFVLIVATCWGCSQNSPEEKKEKFELVLEQPDPDKKGNTAKHELKNALGNLQSLNDHQEEYLKSKNDDENIILQEDVKLDVNNLKKNLEDLNRLNDEHKNLQ